MTGIRRVGALAVALIGLVAPGVAAAAPGDYAITYDWREPTTGFVGWSASQQPAEGTAGFSTPFYSARLAQPRLRVAPAPASDGTRDRPYPLFDANGPRVITQVGAPGSTRIRSATFDQITSRRATGDRQFLRLAVYGEGPEGIYDFTGDAPPPGPFAGDVTYTDVGPITVSHSAARGTSAQVWMFTSCDPSCPTVGFDADGTPRSFGEVGVARLSLFDPEEPVVSVSGELTSGRWTNARGTETARLSATDPGAGIRAITATRRRAGRPAVTVIDSAAPCDRTHARPAAAGREAAPCPERHEATLSQSLGGLPEGSYAVTATTTDDSDRTGEVSFPLRLDRTAPGTLTSTGALRTLLGRWTNRSTTSLTLRARDQLSGIRSLELRTASGRTLSLDPASCAAECPRSFRADATLDFDALPDGGRLPDGRHTILMRATDAAGNVTQRRLGVLQLDRTAPPAPEAVVLRSRTATLVFLTPTQDPQPGSGIAEFVATYRLRGQARLRQTSAAPDELATIRGRRALRLPANVDFDEDVRLSSVDRAGNFSAVALVAVPVRAVCKAVDLGSIALGFLIPGADILLTPLEIICGGLTKGADKAIEEVAPALEKVCGKRFTRCRRPIDFVCDKASGAVCDRLRGAACFASGLAVFCRKVTGDNRLALDRARAQRRRDTRIRRLRGTDLREVPGGGSIRLGGRVKCRGCTYDRATGVRGRVTPRTVAARTGNRRGEAGTTDVPGWKPGCGGKLVRGHLLPRILGGPGGDPRNFVSLPGNFNSGPLNVIEQKLKNEIRDRGGTWEVSVVPRYRGTDPVPISISIVGRRNIGSPGSPRFNPRRADFRRTVPVPRPKERC